MTLNYLTLSGGKVSGTATLTGSGRVITLSGAEANLSGLSATVTQDGAYIGVTDGYLTSSNTYSVLGTGLNTYRFENGLDVYGNAALTIGEGVVLDFPNYGRDFWIERGSTLVATGATLNLTGHSAEDGRDLSTLQVDGVVSLSGCTINGYAATRCDSDRETIRVSGNGNLSLSDCVLNDVNYFDVESGGTASISNTTLQNLTSTGTLTMESCELQNLTSGGTTELDNVTLNYLTLSGGKVSGTATLNGSGRVITLSGAEANLVGLSATATQEGAYIGVTDGGLNASSTFSVLGEGLATYRMETPFYIYSGATLTLEEGVVLESPDYRNSMYVYSGGKLKATNATLNLTGHSNEQGSDLNELSIEGTAELTGCVINGYAATYCDGYELIMVRRNGKLSMTDCRLNDVTYFDVESGGTATICNTTLQNLSNAGTLVLENSTLSGALTLSGGSVSGSGNILTGAGCVMVLQSFSTDLSGFVATATQEGAYVQVNAGSVNSSSSLRVLGEGLDTYRLNTSISVYDGKTFTLGEGVTLVADRSASHDINVNGGGKFIADGATLQLLGESGGDRVNVRAYSGAEVNLKNTVVQGPDTTASRDYEGNFHVYSGGRLVMENTRFVSVDGICVENGGVVEARGLSGDSWMTLNGGASVSIQNSDMSAMAIQIQGNYTGTNKIDLSGNYWGTTNYEEILAKISGYNANYVVLENWLVTAPENAVAIEGLVGDKLLDASENSVTLRFSEEMDATTTTVDKFSIVNELGEAVEITGFELSGQDVVLHFGELPKDGTYSVSVANGLKSADGKVVQTYMSQSGASEYSETLRADVTPETVTTVSLQKSTQPRYVDVVFSGAVNPATAAVGLFVLRGPAGETVAVQSISTPGANTLRLNLPAFSAVGEYTLEMLPGITDYAGNAVLLPEEPLSFTLESADVSVTAADVAYTGHTYGSVQVALTANNAGNVAATGAKVEIWLTKNGSIASDSILLDIVTVDLAAGEQKELTRTLLLEQAWDLAEGEYQLVTRSSWGDELSALRADNTAAIGTLSVSYPPAADLSITAMTLPDSLEPGQSFALQLQVANNGGQPTPAEGLVELGLIQSGADASTMISLGTYTLVASTTGAELAPGESLLLSVPAVQLPAGIALQGAVQVVAIVNPDNTVFEKPEHRVDNTFVAADVLQLEPTLSLSLSRSEVTEGSGLRVVYTITRSGDCSEALTVQVDCALAERLGLPETLTIAAGQSSLRYQAAPVNDAEYLGNASASVAISAAGYKGAQSSISLVEDEKPTLTLTLSAASAAEGTEITGTVSMNTISTVDTVVKLGSTYAAQLNLPESITIKAGESSASFSATVVQDETAEIDKELKITAAATGFNSGTAKVTVVDDDIPQVQLVLNKEIVSESDGYYALTATLVRTGGSDEAITVRLEDVDGIGLILPEIVTLSQGAKSKSFIIGVVDDSLSSGERTGFIRGYVSLDSCGCDASESQNGGVFETSLTVLDNDSPALSIALNRGVLREGAQEVALLTVTSNYASNTDIVVTLSDNGMLNLPESIIITAGSTSASCEITAKADGVTDGTQLSTITAAAEGYVSAAGYLQITDRDIPDLVVKELSVDGACISGKPVVVNITISNEGYAACLSSTEIQLKLSDGTELGTVNVSGGVAAGSSVTISKEVTLPKITGTYSIVAEVDAASAILELSETNNFGTLSGVRIASGYSVHAEVDKEVLMSAETVNITGALTADASGLSVANQQVVLYVYWDGKLISMETVNTDESGRFSSAYAVPSGVGGHYSVKAGVYTEMSQELDSFDVAQIEISTSTNALTWVVDTGESVHGQITIRNTGAVDLTNVRLLIDGVPDNVDFTWDTSSISLAAGATASFAYTLAGATASLSDLYSKFQIQVVSDEGVNAQRTAYSYVSVPDADLSLSLREMTSSISSTTSRFFEVIVKNVGGGDSGRVEFLIPAVEWMSVYSGEDIENLAPGESATVVLKVDPTKADVLLNAPYQGKIAVVADRAQGEVINYDFRFVADDKASVSVNVYDAFSLQNEDNRCINGARVVLRNAYTNEVVKSVVADSEGYADFASVEAGQYYLEVKADGCSDYKMLIVLDPGEVLHQPVYLANQTVTYSFVVTPTYIEDKYEIVQEMNFTTSVPSAEVVFEGGTIMIPDIDYGESTLVQFAITNYGLVEAQNLTLELPSFEGLTLTILNPIDSLAAQSTHTFQMLVTAPEYEEEKGRTIQKAWACVNGYVTTFWFDCTSDGKWRFNAQTVQTEGDCPSTDLKGVDLPQLVPVPHHGPDFGTGGRNDYEDPWYNRPGPTWVGPSLPIFSSDILQCTPCKAEILNAILECYGWDKIEHKQEGPDVCDVLSFLGIFNVIVAGAAKVCRQVSEALDMIKDIIECLNSIRDAIDKCWPGLIDRIINSLKGGKGDSLQGEIDDPWANQMATLYAEQELRKEILVDMTFVITGPFDLRPYFSSADVNMEAVTQWLAIMDEVCVENGESGSLISDSELSRIRSSALYNSTAEAKELLDNICEKWNRTVLYHRNGWLSVEDVPSGESVDFYSSEYIAEMKALVENAYDKVSSQGYEDIYDYYCDSLVAIKDYASSAESEVCATVKLRFSQTATLSREAFDGELILTNNAGSDMSNIKFQVYVKDKNGVDVSEHFSIKYYELDGIDSIDGGLLSAGSTGTIRIQYVPDKTIAAEGAENFSFGGQLSYNNPTDGTPVQLTLTPVVLEVNPSPNLELHYFLTEDVYSDDPYTATLEAVQKAEIGLIVKNTGKGVAHDFTMTDFHPELLENETGLALEITMMGSSLNGGELQKSGTTMYFGDVNGLSTSTAIWYFATNLHGYFSNYTSTFRHVSDLGDEKFSLIESTNTHMLTRSMNVDGDEKMDFLVNDVQDALDLADGIYFGDGSYADVNAVTGVLSRSGQLGEGVNTITLTMRMAEGWNYIRIDDPGMGDYCITGVTVGGVALDSSAFWQTDRIFAGDGTATYVSRLHWVYEAAEDGTVEVVLDYKPADTDIPRVVAIEGIENGQFLRELPQDISVRFSEAINPGTFNVGCVELRKGTERIDLAGLTWTWESADTLVFTNLHEFMTADGVYSLAVRNTNVQDVYGNPGDGTGAAPVRWTLAAEAFAMEGVSGHEQRRENSYVETLYVSFTSSVAEFPADAITLYVTEPDGVTYSVNGAGKLTVTQSDTEGKVFAISGLEGLQVRDGSYSMSIDRSKVLDVNGNACLEFTPVTWELHKTPPSVLASSFVEAEQLVQNIDTVNLQFSHAVGRIDASAIIIRCNGEVYTSDSLVCEIHPDDPTLVIVRGISKATPVGKTAAMPDGEWQLSVDMTGVEDIYGNLGEGTYSADWAVDTIAPVALSGITVNGKDSLVVPHNVVTIGAELPESGLTVSIYDKLVTGSGLGTLLWSGVVAGTTLSQQVTLLSGASHTISVVTTDAAGNSTTSAYNVLVDMVVLTVSTDIEPEYMVMPDTVTITFSTETTDLALSAVQLTVGGKPVSLEGAALTRLSATEWQLSGLSGLSIPAGECALNIDLSTVSKTSSGLLGQGVYTKTFTYDPVSEVKITSCDIATEASVVKSLSIVFSAGINYAALRDSGALPEAVRLVNQADGSVVELDAAGFTYADKTLTWSGEQRLAGGTYAVVVDPALLTSVNGSPLVGNAGSALTSIVSYVGDAVLLGASGTSYSAPYAVDWNGDGHADLLVGEKVGSEGKVRLYLNNGSGGFSDYSYLQSNGADLSVAASGCQGVVVALQDITGDGVADLVAGLSNGSVQYYPGMADGSFGTAAELVASTVAGSRAYPVFHDWNADGVADLVLGTGSGTLMVGLGSKDAATGALSFATPMTIAGIEVPGRAAPVFTDVNGDGSADIILGAGDGSLTLYYATESGYCKTGSWQLDDISWERSRVTVADMNADGTTDLIIGGSTGAVYVVYGVAATGTWSELFEVESGSVISSTSVSVEGKAVTLSWAVDYAEAGLTYVVEVADNAGFANAIRQEVSTTALTLTDMAEGVFLWRVSIKDSAKPAVTGQNFTVDTIVPGAPAELTACAGNGAVVLSWSALDDASGVKYEVRYSATSDFSFATSVFSESNEITLSGLEVGAWYWQVRAVDGAGNAGEWTTAAESFSIDEFVAPESPSGEYWAQGLVVSDNQLVSGYWDADKTGTGDTQLCWAAVSSNMLAWWQSQYGVTDFSSSEVPATADDIFAAFRQNWANVSGREEYGLTWWVSGESENASYGSFYGKNFTGNGEQGAYYAPHYDAAATTALVKEISLTGASAEQVARDWAAVYADGGMMGLGIYRSLSGTTLIGGHTLTLWGFATDAAGRLTSITVSDSDDGTDGVLTLALAYNLTKGYYQIVQSGSNLNGCLLGDYTTLGAFDKADLEDNSAAGAVEITMSEPVNGVSKNTAEHYDWVGTGDTQDFYTFTAPGDGIYRINVNTMELESALWMSVGTLDADGGFVAVTQTQITPGAPISGISGLRLDSGEQQYICISQAEGTTGTAYELNITGDIDEASPITDNNVKRKATKLVGTIYADATVSSWVGSGDALDIYYFDLTEDCNFSLSLSELDKNAKVKLYYDYGDGSYGSIISTTVRAARGLSFADTLEQGTYYLEIASYDNGGGRYNTGYTLELEKEIDGVSTRLSLESDSPFTDNNTKESATELELVPSTDAVITSWVGAGDALDYYSFNVEQAGTLSLCLSELEKNATVRLYQATESGYQQTLSTTVRAARGLDTELTLATGTYFLEIASYDNGAGRYNTTYALELEKEEDGETKRYAIAGSGL